MCIVLCSGLVLLLSFQDFKNRAISSLLLFLFFAFSIVLSIEKEGISGLLRSFLVNFIFLAANFGFLLAYFGIKKRRFEQVVDKYVGFGDILFYPILAIWFSPTNFIVFYVCSLFVALIYYAIHRSVSKTIDPQIPLVGWRIRSK